MESLTTITHNQAAKDLLWIWANHLDKDIHNKKKETLQAEQKLKQFVLDNLGKETRSELHKNRMGCLMNFFFRLILSLLVGVVFHGTGEALVNHNAIRKKARKIKKIFENYDLKAAVLCLYQEQILLPAGANRQLDDCWNREMQIEFLKNVHSIVLQASDIIRKNPEKTEAFVKTYFSLQEEKPDTKSLCKALFTASETLGIDLGNTPDQVASFTSQGCYFDFTFRYDIHNCTNKYMDALK